MHRIRRCSSFTFLFFCSSLWVISADYNAFDDTILYKIKWPGKSDNILSDSINENNSVTALTDKQEKFVCILPESQTTEKDAAVPYNGPSPIDLLKPLFTQSTCSYRLETYWTYEVCHGKHVKQYHEERDGKKIKKQEYFLGRWDLVMQTELSKQFEDLENNKHLIKTKRIEGMVIPYLQLNYTDGTLCDVNEKPRQTNVLYMCLEHGRPDIYSIKEIASCHYEAIIFTPLLCSHPLYKPKHAVEHKINCLPSGDGPMKPTNLISLEQESTKLKNLEFMDDDQVLKKVFAVFSIDKNDGQDGQTRFHVQIHPVDPTSGLSLQAKDVIKPRPTEIPTDLSDFLSGENCLTGEKGWWKFEFCYGKYVNQYHDESSTSRIIVELGKFNLEEHKNWIEKNPSKKPNPKSKTVSHFYSRGTFCDKANILRETEVRFVCSENTISPSAVSLYLQEPQTCKYVLFIESHVICKLLPYMDEYGLFNQERRSLATEDPHIEL